MNERSSRRTLLLWTVFVVINICTSSSLECPSNVVQFLELAGTLSGVVEDPYYEVNVLSVNLKKGLATTESILKFSLREKETVQNCTISLPTVDVNNSSSSVSDLEGGTLISLSGSLYYENGNPFLIKNALFPVFSPSSLPIKSSFAISVALPISNNVTLLSNMPLERMEPVINKTGWMWHRFQKTPPMWSDHVMVVLLDRNDSQAVHYQDPKANRTISLYWRPSTVTEREDHEVYEKSVMCLAEDMAGLLDHYEAKFKELFPLPKLDVVLTSYRVQFHKNFKANGILYDSIWRVPTWTEDFCSYGYGYDFWGQQLWDDALVRSQWFDDLQAPHTPFSEKLQKALISFFTYETTKSSINDIFNPSAPRRNRNAVMLILFESLLTKAVFEHGVIDDFMSQIHSSEKRLSVEDILSLLDKSLEIFNKTKILPAGVTAKDILQNWFGGVTLPLLRVKLDDTEPGQVIISREARKDLGFPGFQLDSDESTVLDTTLWVPLEIVTESGSQYTWLSPGSENTTVAISSLSNSSNFIFLNPSITTGDDGSDFQIIYDLDIFKSITKELSRHLDSASREYRSKLVRDHVRFVRYNLAPVDTIYYLMKYKYENAPSIWSFITQNVLKNQRCTNDGFYGVGDTGLRLHNFFGSVVDAALARYVPINTALSADDHKNVTLPENLLQENLMTACSLVASPGCIEYAKHLQQSWIYAPQLPNPFDQFHYDKQKLQCLALKGAVPADDLFKFYVSRNGNGTSGAYCEAIWCTQNKTLILDNVKSVFINDSSIDDEMKCSPLYGFTSDIAQDYGDLLEPLYQMLKTAVLDVDTISSFIAQYAYEDVAVLNDLDNWVEQYGNMHNVNWKELDSTQAGKNVRKLQEAVLSAKKCKKNMEVVETRLKPLILLLKKEGF